MKPLRCAVIGLGMGQNHARGYQELSEAHLVAVADTNPKQLDPWVANVGKQGCFTDYKKMLKDVKPDLVSIALPNFLHASVSIDCLRAGAHVLCEKPMALDVKQARRMAMIAKQAGRKFGINLSYRFTPAARALKDMAERGFLGQPYHATTRWLRRDAFPGFGGWFGQKRVSGGGPLIDLGVHRIDLAMWLMKNPEPVSVSGTTHSLIGIPRARTLKKPFDVEDFATGFIRFANGASLVLEMSWAGHQEQAEIMSTTVMGTRGTLVHRNEGGGYDFVGEYFSEINGHKIQGLVSAPRAIIPSPFKDMVQAVIHNRQPLAGPEDGIRMQRILDGLYRSAKLKREVRI